VQINSFVGFGGFTENNGSFTFVGQEFGLIGSGGYEEVSLSGKYVPGFFALNNRVARLNATELRYGFMQTIPTQKMAKNWVFKTLDGVTVGEMQFSPNGAVSGSVLDGCLVSGGWLTPNPELNQHRIELVLSGCSAAGPSYAAAIYGPGDVLIMFGITNFGGYILYGQ